MTDKNAEQEAGTGHEASDLDVFVMRGARDMLREAAKQFRATGSNGHAAMCEAHADQVTEAMK